MRIYYDIILKQGNSFICYWADSFSIDENRILKIKSYECGDITVKIDGFEKLIVEDVFVEDE